MRFLTNPGVRPRKPIKMPIASVTSKISASEL